MQAEADISISTLPPETLQLFSHLSTYPAVEEPWINIARFLPLCSCSNNSQSAPFSATSIPQRTTLQRKLEASINSFLRISFSSVKKNGVTYNRSLSLLSTLYGFPVRLSTLFKLDFFVSCWKHYSIDYLLSKL